MLLKELVDVVKAYPDVWYMFPNDTDLAFLAQVLDDPECLKEEDSKYLDQLQENLLIWAGRMRDIRLVTEGHDVGVF
jgi:hypothetical protein